LFNRLTIDLTVKIRTERLLGEFVSEGHALRRKDKRISLS